MTVRITAAPLQREALPALLFDALETLLGPQCRVLDASPPWADSAIFALDGNERPVLVHYDMEDGGRALLAGFATLEKLERELHWLARSYPEFSKGRSLILPDLVIVSPAPPPGAIRLCGENPRLRCFTFRALQINDETGLLLEPVTPGLQNRDTEVLPREEDQLPVEEPVPDTTPPASDRLIDNMVLSDDEEEFFKHL
jgi:hypothetical protein